MKNKRLLIWYLFLLIQPLIDILTSFMVRNSSNGITLGIVVRGIFLIVSIVYILFFNNSKYKNISIKYLILVFLFYIIYFLTKSNILFDFEVMKKEIIYIFKYVYFPISFLFLFNFYLENSINIKVDNKILKTILCITTFSIIIAQITNTSFVSYQFGMQGTSGWFYAANELSAIVSILFPLIFLYSIKNEKRISMILLFPISFAICLIGTKTSFLGLIFVLVFYFIYYLILCLKYKKSLFQLICVSITLFMVLQMSPQLAVVKNFKETINKFAVEKQNQLDHPYNEQTTPVTPSLDSTKPTHSIKNPDKDNHSEHTIVNDVILSNRRSFLNNIYNQYKESNLWDKFFGIGFTNRGEYNIEKLIEMDIFDIFFRYGIVGFIIYFIPFIYIMIKILKLLISKFSKKQYMNINELTYIYIVFIGVGISTLAGHVFGAPAVSIYLSCIITLLYKSLKNDSFQLDNNKITILALHLGMGGVEKYIASLSKIFNEKYDVEIICTYKVKKNPAFNIDKNVKIIYLIDDKPHKEQLKNALNNKKYLVALKEIIINAKVFILKYIENILCITKINSKYIITTRSFHSFLVSKYANDNIVKIASEHNYHNNNNNYIKNVINSIEKFNYFVLVSEELKEFYEPLLPNIKCIYIPNVIDKMPNKRNIKINNELISVGRFSKEKAFNDLIDVINIIKVKNSKIKLHLIGDGPEYDNLKKQTRELSLSKNIIFHGYVDNNNLNKYMNNSSMYVMTSQTEAFGIVLIEAMSYSLPCIAFDSANGAKKLLSRNVGKLVPNRNKQKMADEILNILNNERKFKFYSERSYKNSKKYYIENVKKMWFKIINNKEQI